MKLSVKTFREAGLEVKWGKNIHGVPVIFLRDPQSERKHQREKWYKLTQGMIEVMDLAGIREGFDRYTLLGDIFNIPS